jgi:hypothetical protein
MIDSQVLCRSDSSYAERPVSLIWNGQRLDIRAILDRWRTPEGKWFRVVTGDEQIFELFYNEQWNEWSIRQP